MKVIKWTRYEDVSDNAWGDNNLKVIGGLGGFFDDGMRWKDYIERYQSEYQKYYEALRKEIVEKNIQFRGSDHQQDKHGVPVFEDGTVGLFSYRAWGDLMGAVWSEELDEDFNYMCYY